MLEDEMIKTRSLWLGGGAAVFLAGFVLGTVVRPWEVVHAQSNARVFELRTYTASEGKLDALSARFRNHTVELFKKHGITSVGFFLPQDAPKSQNTFIYLLAYPDRDAAKKNWAEFQADPEWKKAFAESEAQGTLQTKVESVFMNPTDYSPLK
jgi:hypothetical protein